MPACLTGERHLVESARPHMTIPFGRCGLTYGTSTIETGRGVTLRVVAYSLIMLTSLGRPRSTAIDEAVARAVRQLLTDHGYAAMSIEQVASLAKVAKTAIYRRWASKAEMVFAVAIHRETIEPPADQGTLAADMRLLTERVVALLGTPAARHALPGLLADLRGDPLLAKRFHASFIETERQLIESLLKRSVRRGELTEQPDPTGVHAQLLGTAFAWIFLLTDTPPPDLAEQIAKSVLAALQR